MTPPITALGSRYGIQGALGRSVKRASTGYTDWWDLDGTITSCVGAWQAKGVASLAASYVNLTGNSTYDLSEGNAPSWNTATGWTANGTDTWLNTSIPMVSTNTTLIARVANLSYDGTLDGYIIGEYQAGRRYMRLVYYRNSSFQVNNQNTIVVSDAGQSAGIPAMTCDDTTTYGYFNGSFVNSETTGTATDANTYKLFARAPFDTPSNVLNGDMIAAAVYSECLTTTQIGNLTTAMAAL